MILYFVGLISLGFIVCRLVWLELEYSRLNELVDLQHTINKSLTKELKDVTGRLLEIYDRGEIND